MPQSSQFYPYQNFLTPDPTTYFRDNIERFVPAMYTTGEFDGALEFFKVVAAPLLDEMFQRFLELPMLADVDRCPAKFLQLLAGNINVLTVEDTFDETQLVTFRRRELGKMSDVFKIRSVPASFLRILKYQGGSDYGLIIPRRNLMLLDITPISGSPLNEFNDVGERLASQTFDISVLADGAYDEAGNLIGSRISYAIPALIVRSDVKLYWDTHEVPLQHQHPEGQIERSFYFDRSNGTITTNFIPLLGDSVIVQVVGDPFYLQSFRMADKWYWRPGTEEVYSDQNPILRYAALQDRRPIGTLLYFAWLIKFFWTKCFKHPPAIDYTRSGYAPLLPPHEDATWNDLLDCASPDPWFFQISNGYGYEAFWEARSAYQLGRQYPFEASLAPNGQPKNLALHQEESTLVDETVNVPGKTQPWLVSANPTFAYGNTSGAMVPVFVDIPLGADRSVVIERLDGLVNIRNIWPSCDGIGVLVALANALPGDFGQYFPSKYINSSFYPIYEGSLVGCFADNSGVIVGDPFWVGNGPTTVAMPDGATRVQLGITDDGFNDNTGSFNVRVQCSVIISSLPRVYAHRRNFKFRVSQEP